MNLLYLSAEPDYFPIDLDLVEGNFNRIIISVIADDFHLTGRVYDLESFDQNMVIQGNGIDAALGIDMVVAMVNQD